VLRQQQTAGISTRYQRIVQECAAPVPEALKRHFRQKNLFVLREDRPERRRTTSRKNDFRLELKNSGLPSRACRCAISISRSDRAGRKGDRPPAVGIVGPQALTDARRAWPARYAQVAAHINCTFRTSRHGLTLLGASPAECSHRPHSANSLVTLREFTTFCRRAQWTA
jgi:hypothetical protein